MEVIVRDAETELELVPCSNPRISYISYDRDEKWVSLRPCSRVRRVGFDIYGEFKVSNKGYVWIKGGPIRKRWTFNVNWKKDGSYYRTKTYNVADIIREAFQGYTPFVFANRDDKGILNLNWAPEAEA